MSTLLVEICKINSVKVHSNANKLDVIEIKGWQVVTGKDKFKVGDNIQVENVKGRIVHINLVETKIKTHNGNIIFLPNSFFSKKKITKLKKPTKTNKK